MYIKMVGDTTKYQGTLERVGLHLIKVSGLIQHNSGFRLYLDNDVLIGDYSKFVYPYDDPNLGENVFEYSDNNMTYQGVESNEEEKERKKIEEIIEEKVGKDVETLSQQMIEISNILAPMYEVILEIQDSIKSTDTTDSEVTDDVTDTQTT